MLSGVPRGGDVPRDLQTESSFLFPNPLRASENNLEMARRDLQAATGRCLAQKPLELVLSFSRRESGSEC